jgi:hypothetical protein
MKEKGMMMFFDWLDALEGLSGNDFKTLTYAMADYIKTGKTTRKLSQKAQFASMFIFKQLDRQKEKVALGKKGGRPRKDASSNENAENEEMTEYQNEKPSDAQPEKETEKSKDENAKENAKENASPVSCESKGDEKKKYGEFNNVLLTEEEYEALKVKFPCNYQRRIDDLSFYIKSNGDGYSSHYATILSWDRNKKEEVSSLSTGNSYSTFDTDDFFQDALERSNRELKRFSSRKDELLAQLDKKP